MTEPKKFDPLEWWESNASWVKHMPDETLAVFQSMTDDQVQDHLACLLAEEQVSDADYPTVTRWRDLLAQEFERRIAGGKKWPF